MSARDEFKARIEKLKSEGLKDIKFYPGEVSSALPEDFCAEANNMLDAIKNDGGEPLVFDDRSPL